jgi:hypothetical protein
MSYTATPTSSVEIPTWCSISFMAQETLMGLDLTRSHSEVRHTAGLLWTSNRPDAEAADNTQQSQETDIGDADRIRNHNPSQRATSDSRFRSHGHWHRYRIYCPFLCLAKSCYVILEQQRQEQKVETG